MGLSHKRATFYIISYYLFIVLVSYFLRHLENNSLLVIVVRLGFLDKSEAPTIIKAIAVDGVKEITVHCRTRKDLYRVEALDWSCMKPLHELCPGITLIANGNINSRNEALECEKQTLCDHFMCGRGAFPVPNIGHVIKENAKPFSLAQILKTDIEVIEEFSKSDRTEKIVMDRAKQFLGYARVHRKELNPFFKRFCQCVSVGDGIKLLEDEIKALESETDEKYD